MHNGELCTLTKTTGFELDIIPVMSNFGFSLELHFSVLFHVCYLNRVSLLNRCYINCTHWHNGLIFLICGLHKNGQHGPYTHLFSGGVCLVLQFALSTFSEEKF